MSNQIIFEQAISAYNLGDLEEAENLARELLLSIPEEPQVQKLLGFIAYDKELYEQACDIFFNLLRNDSHDSELTLKLANSLEGWGKYSEALDYYERAILQNPNEALGYYGKGTTLQSLGRAEEARTAYNETLSIEKDNWQALLGLASLESSHSPTALEFLNRANNLSANNPFVLYQLAIFYKEDDLTLALNYIEQAIDLYYHPKMQLLQGFLYYQKQDITKALEIYDEILENYPNYILALGGKADILADIGEYSKAKELLTKAVNYDKEYLDGWINLGSLAQRQGLDLEAIENYRKAIHLASQAPETLFNLGLLLQEQGELDEAIGLYFNVLNIDTNFPNLDLALYRAILEYSSIDKESALKLGELWKKSSPNSTKAKELLKTLSD